METKINCEYKKLIPIGDARVHPRNRNKHPDEQIARLAQIIEYQGWRHPIIISNLSGFIVAGHGRLEAAKKLGLKEVPVDFQDFANEEQEYAFLVSDNASALWAELDLSGINADLPDLGPDFDIDLLGIKNFKLDASQDLEAPPMVDSTQFIVSVHCKDEADMSLVYDEMVRRGYECNLIR